MRVNYTYRYADHNHLFSTKDIPGHIIHNTDLATAYEAIPGTPEIPVGQFVTMIEGNIKVLAATNIYFNA